MISGQFLPGLIKDEKLLSVFSEIDREKYLPENMKHLAYSDINIKVDKERYLINPYCLAKIIEKSMIKSKDVVLLIGTNLGYESAIISKLSNTVIALEENINFYRKAEVNLKNSLIDNVVNINGDYISGCKKYSPYDIIIYLGSANFPSEILFKQLSENGKLLICENYNPNLDEGKLFMYTKISKKIFKEYICDLNVPKLNADIYQKSIFNLES